jgi:DNA-binding beta-propeller fold protein YncE
MAVNRGKGTVAVLNETDNTLHRFSADGTEQKWTLPAGQHKLAAHDGIGAFIVANREAGNVMGFIDGPASEPMTFNTGKQPVDLAVDTALSDAFVLNTDGSLSVITPDGKTMEATSINCQVGPFSFPSIEPGGRQAMAVNSTTHEVFLANEGSATLSRITQNGASVHSLSGQA